MTEAPGSSGPGRNGAAGRARLLGVLAAGVGIGVAAVLLLPGHSSSGAGGADPRPATAPPGPLATPRSSSAAPSPSAPSVVTVGGPAATALPAGVAVVCPAATVTVHSADELTTALRAAGPGTSIRLADGVYSGTFVAQNSGTAANPVWLCGGRGAVLDGGGTSSGYALHLDPAEHWRVVGFTVRNAQKGVMADATTGTVLQDLLVEQIGDEAIHLRSASTGNAVLRNTVRGTGLHSPKFGEGIYIGSAESNWKTYSGGNPDRSDHNLVQGNTISDTTSESVDIKEGTTGGALLGNTFDGSGSTSADSWVDVKGNDWLIADNSGTHTEKDGFQTHQILDGWGTGNIFRRNVAQTRGTGVDIYIHKPDDTANQVFCDNRSGSGGPATSNVSCLP